MIVLKIHIKILKYVRRKKVVTVGNLYKKFNQECVTGLIVNRYLCLVNDTRQQKIEGRRCGAFTPDSTVTITTIGIAEAEKHDWFDMEFLAKSFFLPITVSIITTLITLFLKGLL